jgi:hypothetical protein
MVDESAPQELEARLAELEQQRNAGSISEIGFNLRRNLLITRSEELARRRSVAKAMPAAASQAPPVRRTRRGLEVGSERPARRTRRRAEPATGTQSAAAPALPQPQSEAPPLPPPRLPDQPPRRRARRAVPWLAAVVVVAGAALLAYQLGSSARPAEPGTSARTTASAIPSTPVPQSNQAPSPSPSVGTGAVAGQTQAAPGGGTITLAAFAGDLSSIEGADPPTAAGQSFAAVELRVCAGSGAPTSVNPFDFVLVEPGGTPVDTLDGLGEGRQPELTLSEVPPGQCVSGWLSYEVTAAPTALTDTAGGLTWALG